MLRGASSSRCGRDVCTGHAVHGGDSGARCVPRERDTEVPLAQPVIFREERTFLWNLVRGEQTRPRCSCGRSGGI